MTAAYWSSAQIHQPNQLQSKTTTFSVLRGSGQIGIRLEGEAWVKDNYVHSCDEGIWSRFDSILYNGRGAIENNVVQYSTNTAIQLDSSGNTVISNILGFNNEDVLDTTVSQTNTIAPLVSSSAELQSAANAFVNISLPTTP